MYYVEAGAEGLDAEFAERLDPYVRSKYLELLHAVKADPDRN